MSNTEIQVQRLANLATSEDCYISSTETGIWIRVGRGETACERHVSTHREMKRLIALHA